MDTVAVAVNELVIKPIQIYQREKKTIICLSLYSWQARLVYQLKIYHKSDSRLIAELKAKSPEKPSPYLFNQLRLKQIWQFLPNGCRTSTVDVVKDRISIGTNKGHVAVWDLSTQSVIWKRRFSESIIKQVSLNPSGKKLYISQQSADAWLSCYSLVNNTLLWRYRLADDIETSIPSPPSSQWSWLQLPTVAKFQWVDGDLFVAATHVWPNNHQTKVKSQLYRFDADTGQIKWKFPFDKPLPILVRWFDIASGKLAFICDKQSTVNQYESVDIPSGSVVILNSTDGKILFQQTLQRLDPYYKAVTFWRGVSISPNGKAVNVTTDDGRAFMFREMDAGWQQTWQTELTTPIEVNQMPITATAGTVLATDQISFFVTGDTFIPYHLQTGVNRPPMAHPNGMTLFAYGWNGELDWQWQLDNMPQGIDIANGYLIVATSDYGESTAPETKPKALTVFDLKKTGTVLDKYCFTYRLAGQIPYGQIAFSERWIVCIETKSRGSSKTIGQNQIYVIR